jgi:Putative beta-barrel porin 2
VERNIRAKTNVYGSARYWLTPDWWLIGRVEQVRLRNDRTQRSADRDDNYVSMGVEYRTQADNSVLVQLRRTDGNAPNDFEFEGFIFDNDFKQDDVETVLDWRNGFLRSRARIGYTQRQHNDFSDRDFSGITGYWSQDWFATGKLAVNVTAKREIGSYQDFTANYIETSAISLTPTWVLSDKLRLQAGLELRRRDYKGDPQLLRVSIPRRSDNLRSLSISALYAPRRNIDLAVSLRQQDRNSNVSAFDYGATSVDATVSIGF